jgi:hypothetical protein
MSSIVSTLAMTTPNVIKVKCARTNLFIQRILNKILYIS